MRTHLHLAKRVGLPALLLLALGIVACSGQSLTGQTPAQPQVAQPQFTQPGIAPTPGPQAMPPQAMSPQAMSPQVAAQVQRGTPVYAQSCARCHGAMGEGGTAPKLIGPGSLPTAPARGQRVRTGAFNTAMDLGMFIKTHMPDGGPATPPSDVAAVLAYLLKSNGITPPTSLSPSSAGAIRLR